MTNAQDQQNLRERRKSQGFKRLEVWVIPKWENPIRDLILKLKRSKFMLGINLEKGESLDLTKKSPGLSKVFIGTGWDVKAGGKTMDADLMSVSLTANGKVRNSDDVCFFNRQGKDGDAIWHSGDNLTGEGEGDDEVINVDLSKVSAEIVAISFIVNIYDAAKKGQTLADLDNAHIRAVNAENKEELAHFKVTETTGTTINFCQLKRGGEGWEFVVDGSTDSDELGAITQRFAA